MASIKLKGDTSGEITIDVPAVAGTNTLTLPASTGNVVTDSATQTLTNKTLTSPTLTTPNVNSAQFATVSGTAPLYGARAWVNFNGTGTVAIRESGNVSSITDNGTGNYTINFTTALPDVNYSTVASANQAYWSTACGVNSGQTTTSTVLRITGETAYRDLAEINVAVFR